MKNFDFLLEEIFLKEEPDHSLILNMLYYYLDDGWCPEYLLSKLQQAYEDYTPLNEDSYIKDNILFYLNTYCNI